MAPLPDKARSREIWRGELTAMEMLFENRFLGHPPNARDQGLGLIAGLAPGLATGLAERSAWPVSGGWLAVPCVMAVPGCATTGGGAGLTGGLGLCGTGFP